MLKNRLFFLNKRCGIMKLNLDGIEPVINETIDKKLAEIEAVYFSGVEKGDLDFTDLYVGFNKELLMGTP